MEQSIELHLTQTEDGKKDSEITEFEKKESEKKKERKRSSSNANYPAHQPRLSINRSSFETVKPTVAAAEQVKMIREKENEWAYTAANNLEKLKQCILDISQRGHFGETLLHIAFLFHSNDCAKYLIQNYPTLLLEVYEKDEYRGESCLHMAIATSNFEMIDFMLDITDDQVVLDKLINQLRATGNFFNPHWGTVDYGEHALCFAVVCNQKDTVTKLINKGARIDIEDELGNTIFHYMVRDKMYIEMFNHVIHIAKKKLTSEKFQELLCKKNKKGFSFFQYSAHLQQKAMFEHILEWKRETCWKWGDISFVAYPLDEIDTHGVNQNSVLETLLADNGLNFVEIPVILAIFTDKWDSYAKKYFYIWAISHIIYVGLIIKTYLSFVQEDDVNGWIKSPLWVKILLFLPLIKLFVTSFQTIHECYELSKEHGRRRAMKIYFQWNTEGFSAIEFFHILLFISNCLIIGLWISILLAYQSYILVFMTFSCITEALYMLFFAQAFKGAGRLVVTTLRILAKDIVRFAIVYFSLLIGFAGGVSLINHDYSYEDAFIALVELSLGLGRYWADEDEYSHHEWKGFFSRIIYFLFLIFTVVTLLNLLVAIMTETIDAIAKQADAHWLYQWASTILLIERRIYRYPCIYKRTGHSGSDFGFDEDKYYVTFHLIKGKLHKAKRRSQSGEQSSPNK